MDFKDASTVPADPDGKQQHVVEVLNFVDAGTSSLLSAQVNADFHAETAFDADVTFLQQYGRPKKLTFDRDPRWVGSARGRDFPSALVRFLLCLGVEPNICPPRQPQKNPYVERYHRAFGKECLEVLRPGTEGEVREATDAFFLHYNTERPNQAFSCGNGPPRVAYPDLPTLPALPEEVDPDAWLAHIHGQAFARRIQPNGTVEVDRRVYYIKHTLVGQQVVLLVNAPERMFEVLLGREPSSPWRSRDLSASRCRSQRMSPGCARKRVPNIGAGCSSTGAGDRRAYGPVEGQEHTGSPTRHTSRSGRLSRETMTRGEVPCLVMSTENHTKWIWSRYVRSCWPSSTR
jgi:hypothetical protein